MSKFLLVSIVFLSVISFAVCSVLNSETLINGWIVIAVCLALSLITGVKMWRMWMRLTKSKKIWLNYVIHVGVACGFIMLCFYLPNYIFSDSSSVHDEKAVVERTYSKTRYKSKRISRRVYGRGEPYKVYFVDVKFNDGSDKTLEISLRDYKETHKNDTLEFDMEQGLWGIPVIKRLGKNLYVTVPHSSYRESHP